MELIGKILDGIENLSKKAGGVINEMITKAEKVYLHRLTNEELFRVYVRSGRNAKDAVDTSYSGNFSRLDALHTWDAAEREWIERGFNPIHLYCFHKRTESEVANLGKFKRDSDFYRRWAKEIKEGYNSGRLPFSDVYMGRISDQ